MGGGRYNGAALQPALKGELCRDGGRMRWPEPGGQRVKTFLFWKSFSSPIWLENFLKKVLRRFFRCRILENIFRRFQGIHGRKCCCSTSFLSFVVVSENIFKAEMLCFTRFSLLFAHFHGFRAATRRFFQLLGGWKIL